MPYCKDHSGSSPRYDCKPCQEVIADLRSRPFPILGNLGHISWALADEAYPAYSKDGGRGQTIERLAQRGGFSPGELDKYRPDWRPVEQRLRALNDQSEQAIHLLHTVPTNEHQHNCGMKVGDRIESCTCHCKPILEFLDRQ